MVRSAAGAIDPADHEQSALPTDELLEIKFQPRESVIHDRGMTGMNSAADVAVEDAVIERENLHARREQPFAPSAAVTHHVIGGDEPARLLDLRLLLRLQDRAIRARDRDRVLRQDCAGQGEDNCQRTRAAELDFGSEANHAVSNYQTVFAAVPTVKHNQPPASYSKHVRPNEIEMRFSFLRASAVNHLFARVAHASRV